MTRIAVQDWIPYCGAAPLPADWWARWNIDPLLIAVLLLAALAVFVAPAAKVGRREPLLAAIGLAAVLFVSPLCALGSALFLARTVHHVVLLTGFAALLSALPVIARAAGRLPLAAVTAMQVAVLWGWHAPGLYAAALSHDAVFWVMQANLAGSAALFWAGIKRAPAGASVLALLATLVLTGLLGALLAFVPRALYAPHWLTTQAWGLSPLEDQQLAGLVMWAPAAAIYLLAACAILYRGLASASPSAEAAPPARDLAGGLAR